jgi:hypothetical protein
MIREHHDGRSPIVVEDPFAYVQLTYYSPPEIAASLRYLTPSPPGEHRRSRDPASRVVRLLASVAPIHVEEYGRFTAAQRDFPLYWNESVRGWVAARLRDDGADLRLFGRRGGTFLFRVSLPP